MESLPSIAVLAGGLGRRIEAITGGKPKALLRLLGKHLVEYVLDNLLALGARRVYVVVSNPRDFEDVAVKYGYRMDVELVRQRGHEVEGAIESLRDVVVGDLVLLYGDVVAPREMYEGLLNAYLLHRAYGAVVVPEEEAADYLVVRLAPDGSISGFAAGEGGAQPTPGAYVVGGAFVVPRAFVEMVSAHGSFVEALNELARRVRLVPYVWSGWWVDVEYPWDLLRASLYLLQQLQKSVISREANIAPTAVLEGPVVVERGAEVDHYAVIKGPVYVGEGTYIGTHTLVRSYVTFEGDNVVGAYSEVMWSSVQRGVSIGRGSFVGFSVVGEGAVIEPGVVTLNVVPKEVRVARAVTFQRRGREYTKLGAVVGAGKRVRAYTVLRPGEEVR